MKIIIATPRTGSTFYSRYLQLTNPSMECLDEFFQYQFYPTDRSIYDVTTERLSVINDNHIIKILVGKEIDKRVWERLINNKIPATFVKRRNIKRQILSFGIAALNDVWVRFETHVVGIRKNEIILDNKIPYKKFEYTRELFDNITYRIEKIEEIQTMLTVDNILYYEDIVNFKYSKTEFTKKIMPIKQNPIDDDEMISFFTNANELDKWISEFNETHQRPN
jgi:hypothetical protein